MYRRIAYSAALILLAPACATKVYHPSKSPPEMQADIKFCSDEANRRFWMDPVAALYNAYDCLEAKGYSRAQAEADKKVERAVTRGRRGLAPGEVCQVPCRPPPRS